MQDLASVDDGLVVGAVEARFLLPLRSLGLAFVGLALGPSFRFCGCGVVLVSVWWLIGGVLIWCACGVMG